MYRRKDMQIDVRLYNLRGISGVQGACQITRFLAKQGFTPAIPAGRKGFRPLPLADSDIEPRITKLFRARTNWSRDRDFGRSWFSIFPIPLITQGFEELITTASFEFFAPDYFSLIVGGLIDFEFKDQSEFITPFITRLEALTLELLDNYAIDYGYLFEGEDQVDAQKILDLKLPMMNWINLFGPEYVKKYGKEFLLGMPGYEVRELANDSIFHKLTPDLLTPVQEVIKVRREIREYFTAHLVTV